MPKSATNSGEISFTVEQLAGAIQQAVRSSKFLVAGSLPSVDPQLVVDGLGRVPVPLKHGAAKALIEVCHAAPYGQGTRTLVDLRVRKTFELDAKKFRLGDDWNAAIAKTTRAIAEQLGLPADQLAATPYKLLIYEKGGFFVPHRDSEKHDRMVASLIVVLPNPFDGGNLIVRHGEAEERLTFEQARNGTQSCFAAFYADCEHEVEVVTRGVRLALAYNLTLVLRRSAAAAVKPAADAPTAAALRSWIARQPAKPLVFALQHQYTRRGLSLDLLKGADRTLADLVISAAEKADCLIHLAHISRHLLQFADDGRFGRGDYGYRRAPRRAAIEIGETYSDEFTASDWVGLDGKRPRLGVVALDPSAVVSSIPLQQWQPTSEEFEGYTGNAGNTLDRWYHRTALIVWHREHHFDVLASCGANDSIPQFCARVKRLVKTPKSRLEAARAECRRFAAAIIAKWPRRLPTFNDDPSGEKSIHDDFVECLSALNDRDLTAKFLATLADHDPVLRIGSFVLNACREFGWSVFDRELRQLLASSPKDRFGPQDTPVRDLEWVCEFCRDPAEIAEKSELAREYCALLVERFCKPRPARPAYYSDYDREQSAISAKALTTLLTALTAGGRAEDLSRVVDFVRGFPREFLLDDCVVPALKTLVPWSRKRFGAVPPQLVSWLEAVRQRLETATASEPAPPTDWARPAEVDCNCRYCGELKQFLRDPAAEIGRIAAREDMRGHLIGTIQRHRCDVEHALERRGSPFSLVLTKTNGSFTRAVKRFEADVRLLGELPSLS